VRASVGCFNMLDDIDALLDAVGRIARTEPAASAAAGIPEMR
jgi:hypothetical protein